MTTLHSGGIAAALLGLAACSAVPVPEAAPDAPVAEQSAKAWTAQGQEPFWSLSMGKGEMVFVHDLGASTVTAVQPAPEAIEGGRRFSAPAMTVTLLNGICEDSATGVPYPERVTVDLEGRIFEGCGGDPNVLLEGAPWIVEDVNLGGVIDNVRVTLAFDAAAGRVSGRAGCNSYSAGYSVGGEGIAFRQAVSTRMACAPALMNLERKFFGALDAATRLSFDETGALVLSGPDGTRILARR